MNTADGVRDDPILLLQRRALNAGFGRVVEKAPVRLGTVAKMLLTLLNVSQEL